MGDLAFLWHDCDAWYAQVPYGPLGRGSSQEAALAGLREALHEQRRWTMRKEPTTSPILEILRSGDWDQRAMDREREWIEEIDSIGLDQFLLISHDAFSALLDEQCTRVRPNRRLLGRDDRPVVSLVDHPAGSFFRYNRILWIESELYELEAHSHWVPSTQGLFAFDGSRLRYLNRRPENLQHLFEVERRPLDEVDANCIALLVSEAAGRRGNAFHTLVTVDSLECLERTGDYEIDRGELARIASALEPAAISTHADGWTLRFATTFGWMGEQQEVVEWRVDLSNRFALDIAQQRLSERIFSSMPLFME